MDKLDLFFTAVFIVGTVITMILLYFYNVRHKYEVEDELDDFEVEIKTGEKALYKPSESFDWNLYESDLKYDYGRFVGYDLWKNEKAANARIEYLREEYQKDNSILKINMLETMMLVDKYGDDVILDSKGIFRIRKINIENFLNELEYTMETIQQISTLKDELEFSIENYEIDAKKIFYIMKNAKSLGVYNFNNHSQVLLFAKKHKQTTIDAEIVIEDLNGMSEMDLLVSDFIEYKEEEGTGEAEKEDIFNAYKKIKTRTKISFNDDGDRVVEYPNGQKIIKKNLWEVEAIEEKDDRDRFNKNNPNNLKKKFSDLIEEEPVSDVMKKVNDSQEQNFNPPKSVPKVEKTKEIEDASELVKIENDFILRSKLYDSSNNKKDLIGFLGNVNTLEEFTDKLKTMSDKNIKTIMILLLSVDAAQLRLDDEQTSNLIFELGGDIFISYEYIALVLLSLIENRSEFALENRTIAKNGLLRYPINIVELFIKFLSDSDTKFSESESSFKYISDSDNYLLSINVIKLSRHSQELLSMYNSPDKIASISTIGTTKEAFKKSTSKKYQVNFKTFTMIQ